MAVLVTGGAGYIGSTIVDQLVDRGDQVIVADNLCLGYQKAVNPQAVFEEGNLLDAAFVESIFEKHNINAVIHMAARSQVGESVKQPLSYIAGNVRIALNVLESMVKHEVPKFVFSSTANLYGSPETMPITEAEKVLPGSPYGESKYQIERTLDWLNQTVGLCSVAFRYFNAAGATELKGEAHNPETHLIPLTIQVALKQREKLFVFGDDYPTPDGTCIRDYIHVSDLASAHLRALESFEEGHHRLNLGSGIGASVLDVISAVEKVSGEPIPYETVERRAGDLAVLVADAAKARELLNWAPQYTSLESIVDSAWQWHKKHPEGY